MCVFVSYPPWRLEWVCWGGCCVVIDALQVCLEDTIQSVNMWVGSLVSRDNWKGFVKDHYFSLENIL